MRVKLKTRKHTKTPKLIIKNKKSKKSHQKSYRHRHQSRKMGHRMRGGNYETDVTTRTLEGTPTKPLNKVVVTVPGFGTMSGSAYVRLMEDLDRNGKHYYD
jgi:hypothetical protein